MMDEGPNRERADLRTYETTGRNGVEVALASTISTSNRGSGEEFCNGHQLSPYQPNPDLGNLIGKGICLLNHNVALFPFSTRLGVSHLWSILSKWDRQEEKEYENENSSMKIPWFLNHM
ncbi:hypothetical protein Tco_0243089 [Tanacetum coccineum]